MNQAELPLGMRMDRVVADFSADLRAARSLRDDGMRRAAEHADRLEPEWTARAEAYIVEYARMHPVFSGEIVRRYAEASGLPSPPDPRAWGNAFKRAQRAAVITSAGYESSTQPQAHCRPVRIWRSRLIAPMAA